ncbi:MAG: amidohydrolase family protein [Proteobacteria bacterium]|nr:amidohydrolase family protein [Pseudomonadota bacterium]
MIIDIHTHIFGRGWIPEDFFAGVSRLVASVMEKDGIEISLQELKETMIEVTVDPTGELLLAEMEDSGIDKSVMLTCDFALALGEPEVSIQELNKIYADLSRRFPDKLIAFAGMDPRRNKAPELLTKCIKEWGMKGLKLHPAAGFYPNGKETYDLLEVANELKIPVLIHSGSMVPPLKSKFTQSIHFDDIATDFPDLTIIAAHAGGLFGYQSMLSLMVTRPNIYVDISAWQIAALKNMEHLCRALRDIMDFSGSHRILFGSDSPSLRSQMTNKDWVDTIKNLPEKASGGIKFTEEEVSGILGRNAQRILKI